MKKKCLPGDMGYLNSQAASWYFVVYDVYHFASPAIYTSPMYARQAEAIDESNKYQKCPDYDLNFNRICVKKKLVEACLDL